MIFFTKKITQRLTYVVEYLLAMQYGINYQITTDIDVFKNSKDTKINYSEIEIKNTLQILPEGLLSEKDIRKGYPVLSEIETMPVIFSNKTALGFDILSAIFWFISRYEEYMSYNPDSFGRFSAKDSFSFKNNILNRPIVDEWVVYFEKKILQQFNGINIKEREFKAITTIDVDSPWCYKNKGVFRNTIGVLLDILRGNFGNVVLRLKVLLGITEDPWYRFNWLLKEHKKNSLEIIFFVHIGDYGKYDKTVSYKKKNFINFIREISKQTDVFLHPSYKASENIKVLKKEIDRLSLILKSDVVKSRQHYLKIIIPNYYLMLIKAGIKEDFTMGFADKPGFRAGTSNKFYFFDLKANKTTSLLVNPFVVMDRTLKTYENTSNKDAIITIKELINNVKNVNGTFISLWHNESLSNMFEWKGWSNVFEETLDSLKNNKQ